MGSVCQLHHQGARSRAGKGGEVRSQEEGIAGGLHPREDTARAPKLKVTGKGEAGDQLRRQAQKGLPLSRRVSRPRTEVPTPSQEQGHLP